MLPAFQAYESCFIDHGYNHISCFDENRCEKAAWYGYFAYVVCTLLAQVTLTVRSEAFSSFKRSS